MKKTVLLLLMITTAFVFNSCEEDLKDSNTLNYITFSDAEYSAGVDPNGTTTVDIPVYSTNISASDRSFEISVDDSSTTGADGSYTVPSTVIIPGGSNEGTLSVVLSDVNLGIGINSLVLNFKDAAGLYTGDPTTLNYVQNCTEVTATLDIVFDDFPEETGWRITDGLGGTIASKAIGTYAEKASASESIQLCSGRDYTLVITDQYGDGMFDGVNSGSYTLTIGGIVKVSDGGSFGATQSNEFDTN